MNFLFYRLLVKVANTYYEKYYKTGQVLFERTVLSQGMSQNTMSFSKRLDPAPFTLKFH